MSHSVAPLGGAAERGAVPELVVLELQATFILVPVLLRGRE